MLLMVIWRGIFQILGEALMYLINHLFSEVKISPAIVLCNIIFRILMILVSFGGSS
jgi:hypothetical protein